LKGMGFKMNKVRVQAERAFEFHQMLGENLWFFFFEQWEYLAGPWRLRVVIRRNKEDAVRIEHEPRVFCRMRKR
jgi:hypothetical protein